MGRPVVGGQKDGPDAKVHLGENEPAKLNFLEIGTAEELILPCALPIL